MKIDIELPSKYEKKWQRIAAFLGKDIDALIVHGIDCAWKDYSKEIIQSERTAARYKRKMKNV